ncbi:MAG: hypothetical protein N4A33_06920 [Bacteriovoracaceae bacterium]|nr:hypothetical protein [Bacteriovoracaceae bacterium]
MKYIYILSLFISFSSIADICICQYPKEDAHYGSGQSIEVPLYKMGCRLWLTLKKNCRRKKIRDINNSLEDLLDKQLNDGETIKLGFVGHWNHSQELVDYIEDKITPLVTKYKKSSFELDNTACNAMDNPMLVQKKIQELPFDKEQYIKVVGNQTISIGMWDKLSIRFRKTDLIAIADSRSQEFQYPACSTYLGKRCTGFQNGEKGFCSKNGEKKEIVCHNFVKEFKYKTKMKRKKKWQYLDEIQRVMTKHVEQEEYKIYNMKRRAGLLE